MSTPAPTPAPTPIDYVAQATSLGLRGTCVIHEYQPENRKIERPAACSDGALTIVLTEAAGRWSDSPPMPILTVTHRASGSHLNSVAGPYPATPAGLRQAKAAAKVLRGAPGFNWAAEDPSPSGVPADVNAATLREIVGDLGIPKVPKSPRKPRVRAG